MIDMKAPLASPPRNAMSDARPYTCRPAWGSAPPGHATSSALTLLQSSFAARLARRGPALGSRSQALLDEGEKVIHARLRRDGPRWVVVARGVVLGFADLDCLDL